MKNKWSETSNDELNELARGLMRDREKADDALLEVFKEIGVRTGESLGTSHARVHSEVHSS